MWYLSDPGWPAPNLVLLQNALRQTGWEGAAPIEGNWRELVGERLQNIDTQRATTDVLPFLERPGEADLLRWENFERLVGGK